MQKLYDLISGKHKADYSSSQNLICNLHCILSPPPTKPYLVLFACTGTMYLQVGLLFLGNDALFREYYLSHAAE